MLELTSDQKLILETISNFMKKEIAPISSTMDEKQELAPGIKEKCAELGLFSLIIPEEYGAMGFDLTTYCLAIEEISKVDASIGVTVQCSGTGLRPILLGGDSGLKKRIFSDVVHNGKLFGFAITEPDSGSDTASIRTRAIRIRDKYVLNGRKCFITNGGIADYYLTFAVTAPGEKNKGISAFVVDANSPGLQVGKKENKMGLRASPTTDLVLEDLEVPVENLVGKENEGFSLLMHTLDSTRPTIGAQALGIAEAALNYAFNYANQRQQFGKPISQFQGIQFMLADMATQIEAARALLYTTTRLYDQGFKYISPYSAMSKLYASDVAMKVTTDAVQILGGYGYIKDYQVEKLMRDAKITQIYEGTNQIQRVVIGKWMAKIGYPLM